MNKKFKIRLFTVFLIIMLCIAFTTREMQNDTFYMIKLGDYIFHHGVDLIDHYSWVADLAYTYPHWLYDLLIYIVYNNFGFDGVYVSSIVLFILLILSVYIVNLRINKSEVLASLVSIVTIPCMIGFVTARAQLITIILFLWEVHFIERLLNTGFKRYILLLVLISLGVANLHATIWPFYLILYFPFIGHYIVRVVLDKKNNNCELIADKLIIDKIKNFKLLIYSMLGGLIMGFLTPSKICFSYIFKVMQGNSQDFILEHAPAVLINNVPLLVFLVVIILVFVFSKVKVKLFEFFMLGGLTFMTLCSVRHVAFFYIVGFMYFSIICNRYLVAKKDKTLDLLGELFVKNKILYILSFIFIIFVFVIKFNESFFQEYVPDDVYPVYAVKYIKNNLAVDNIKLYNGYNYGSYLLFNDIPVFIDSRCDLYLMEFNGLDYSVFDDAMNMDYNYEERFEFYGVTHALVSNNTLLKKLFDKDNKFDVLYSDDNFTLFEVIKNEI